MWNILLQCRNFGFLINILNFAKKGQKDRNWHFCSFDPGRGIAFVSSSGDIYNLFAQVIYRLYFLIFEM